jgi:hypothetical protein
VQRCLDGKSWWHRNGADDEAIAKTLCAQHAQRAGKGASVRVVDCDRGGAIVFQIDNPTR